MDYMYMPFNFTGSYLSNRYYWKNEENEIKDLEKMLELCPENIEYIKQFVLDECDRQEYEGSIIYDEYPDKLGVIMMVGRIHKELMEKGNYEEIFGTTDVKDLILMVLICEMYKRRNKRRGRRNYSINLLR